MAYQTGTVASAAALLTVIKTFATDNGWANPSGDNLSKANSYISLASYESNQVLGIKGWNSSFTVAYESEHCIYIPTANWPATYYLFTLTSPDVIICFLQHSTNMVENMMFGEIVKVNSSAYVGGNFIHGSRLYKYGVTSGVYTSNRTSVISDTVLQMSTNATSGQYNRSPILFCDTVGSGLNELALHAEINGTVWVGTNTNNYICQETISQLYRGPNTWNSQTHLVPIHVQRAVSSSRYMYLGYVEHIRFVRLDNYELGDIITIGSDKWKVFPWMQKNTVERNGGINHTGTIGAAIRYDGP